MGQDIYGATKSRLVLFRYSAGRCACCALNGISGQGKWAPQILLAQGQFGDLFFSIVTQQMGVRTMRNLVISVLVIGLLSLLPLSPRVGPSSGLLPVSISLGQDEAKAYVTYRRARVTTRRVYRRSYYHY